MYCTLIDPKQAKYDIEGLFENVPYAYVDPEIFALYAATDSMMTDKIYLWEQPFFEGIDNEKLKWLFENIEMPIVEVTAKMEMQGACVDQDFGELLKAKYNNELTNIDNKINAILNQLKDIISAWRLSPEANEKTRTYVPKKSKMSQEKIEETYNLIDTDGRRYRETKPKTEQLKDPINLNASTQLAILFYDILCVSEVYKNEDRKTGKDDLKGIAESLKNYVTEEQREALDKAIEIDAVDSEEDGLKSDGYSAIDEEDLTKLTPEKATIAATLCGLLLERRGLTKLITTYIDTIPALAKHWKDGRVRFRLNSTGTDTGRYSSGGKWKYLDENNNKVTLPGINIQNIPSHNPEIRMLFKAKVEEVQKEFDDLLVVPEITEVETVNGYQYCRDLQTGDKLLINDGEVIDIKDITYNANKKEYSIKI
jgi:GTPase SAR1 family protein